MIAANYWAVVSIRCSFTNDSVAQLIPKTCYVLSDEGDNQMSLEDMLRMKNDSKLSFDDLDDDQEDSDDEAMPGLTEDKDDKEEEEKK